jgi:hypothetical protein
MEFDEVILDHDVSSKKPHTGKGRLSIILFFSALGLFVVALTMALGHTAVSGLETAQRLVANQAGSSLYHPGQFLVTASFLLFLTGFMMGIAGSMVPEKNKHYAITGLILNGSVLFGFIILLFMSLSKYHL